jgi:hypothetical protein
MVTRLPVFKLGFFRVFTWSFVISPSIFATTLGGGAVDELSHDAQWIGRVQIESIETISSSSTFPFSKIKGQILEVFKGSGPVGESISFQLPGGSKGGKTFAVVGLPIFKVGGEYVLFLDNEPRVGAVALSLQSIQTGLVGWTAFRVMTAHTTQSRVVIRAGEPSLLQESYHGMHQRQLIHDRSVKSYEDFVSEIYRALD